MQFKIINGLDNYKIYSDGRIWSNMYNRFMKTSKKPSGYYDIELRKDNAPLYYRVHRLIAEAFIPNPNNYPCVNHIDNNLANNNVDNLEWCTHKMNSTHMVKQNRQAFGIKNGRAVLTEQDVLEIRDLLKCQLFNYMDLAKIYNVTRQLIYAIKNRLIWKHLP